jgi:aspartate kinase
MKVLKFGGISVGSAAKIKKVADLVTNDDPKIVVLSAMAKTTDRLVAIADHLYRKNSTVACQLIEELESQYMKTVRELFAAEKYLQIGRELIRSHFNHIRSFTQDLFTTFEEKTVLAQGELLSTAMFHYYLSEKDISSVLLPALNFMRIDRTGEPDEYYIHENLLREMEKYPGEKLFITQGYICRNAYGEIDNLKRGGSDYTASLVGAAIRAEEIQIWTDIDGMHNNDPRYVKNTQPIGELSFEEASELAYFGAKILHPTSILPAIKNRIPVLLKNTMDPKAAGTLITDKQSTPGEIKAVAAKDRITAIKIKSTRMLLAYGFLRKVFEVFESYQTPIDMITTSEVGVSLTIDDDRHLDEIIFELNKFGTVTVDRDQVIICVVGEFTAEGKGIALKILEALRDIPLRMISYGGSNHNISLLVHSDHKVEALQALSKNLF